MGKPTESILSGDQIQRGCNGLLEIFPCASTYPPQKGFQFGERFFNRREIRRVSWQKQQATPFGFDRLLHPTSQVNREIIQDHDLPWLEAWGEHLLDVDLKSGAICDPIQHKRWSHAGQRQRGDQGHDGSIIAGDLAYCALSSWGICTQRGHGDVGTGLVNKDQILARQVSGLCAPGGTFRFLLLACSYGLFFRVQPKAILARLILAGLTLMPWEASHIWQCCSRVASGLVFNCSNRPACNAAPLRLGRPGMVLGKTWPLSRRALRYRLMVAVEMAKVSATSA